MTATRFEDSLPASIQELMDIEDSELGDFSEALRAQTLLARLATRRALKAAAAEESSGAEVVEMGDTSEVPNVEVITEKGVNKRLEIAANLNRSVVEIKSKRLEAIDKFKDKANDRPKPMNIVFTRAETSPRHMILRYLRLNRIRDAKIVARDHNLDWKEFEPHVNKTYSHQEETENA